MNKLIVVSALGLAILAPTVYMMSANSAPATQPADPVAATQPVLDAKVRDIVSYGIGADLAQTFEVNLDKLSAGVADAKAGKGLAYTEEELADAMRKFQTHMQAVQMSEYEQHVTKLKAENLKAGAAFLEKNSTAEGVKTTASGLQWKTITQGTGPSPGPNDAVTAHYRGTLLDGTVFDSSYQRNKPETFDLQGVIPGWTEGLQLMKVGGKYQLFVPANLAYGESWRSEEITPNSTLLFDIELLGVQKPGEEPATQPATQPAPRDEQEPADQP